MEDEQRRPMGESSDSWVPWDTEGFRRSLKQQAEQIKQQRQRIEDRLEALGRRLAERRR
jgi:hypothetical protein